MAQVVEHALERDEASVTGRQPAAEFDASLRADPGDDVDLMEIINEVRKPHKGMDL